MPEFRSVGKLYVHARTGCEVFRLENEDNENLFVFTFRTPPESSNGASHIIEHSVLCGSERFPVRDPFVVMLRRSIATYINALTFTDKTAYPAATILEKDFYNLIEVYGDAVFFPRLTQEVFEQEAHHLVALDGGLDIKGVVYNEMRGDYASAESIASTYCQTSLFSKGHPYSFDSGGDPQVIPNLDYQTFLNFWKTHYHPSNCRIFIYGSIDTDKVLDFLDKRFLARFDRVQINTAIPLQEKWDKPVLVEKAYPALEDSHAHCSTVVNWLTLPVTDELNVLAMQLVAEMLLGHDGAPLSRALRESGLGMDISPQSGLDTELRQMIFSAGMRGTKREDWAKMPEFIVDFLKANLREICTPESIESALHSLTISSREIHRGSGTYSLRLFRRTMRGWLHGSKPEKSLSFETPLAQLRERIDKNPQWLPDLLESTIINNNHRSTVVIYPDKTLFDSEQQSVRARMADHAKALGEAGLAAVREKAAKLEALQSQPPGAEALATLPRLVRSDIPFRIEKIARHPCAISGCDARYHPLFTNGIVYLDVAFSLDSLSEEDYPWMPLFSRFITGAGLPGMPWYVVAEKLAGCAGGFSAHLNANTHAHSKKSCAFLTFRLKCLAEKSTDAFDIAARVLSTADFRDSSRLSDVFLELRNDVLSSVIPWGNSFASARACSGYSNSLRMEELWTGISQLEFLQSLVDSGSQGEKLKDASVVSEILSSIAAKILVKAQVRFNFAADPQSIDACLKNLESSFNFMPAHIAYAHSQIAIALQVTGKKSHAAPAEGFRIPSQVGFAAQALPSATLLDAGFGNFSVLSHLLSTGPLWESIRVKGGAYGAGCSCDPLEGIFVFSTYRDPQGTHSLEQYAEILQAVAAGTLDTLPDIEEASISIAGKELRPLMPSEKSFVDFSRELYGITDDMREQKLKTVLACSIPDIRKAARALIDGIPNSTQVLLAPQEEVDAFCARIKNAVRTHISL